VVEGPNASPDSITSGTYAPPVNGASGTENLSLLKYATILLRVSAMMDCMNLIPERKPCQTRQRAMPEAIAADDIVLEFSRGNGANGYFIRIASRHGHKTMPNIIASLRPYLAEGWNLVGYVESPSRFTQ
jgi:hypothetical protein